MGVLALVRIDMVQLAPAAFKSDTKKKIVNNIFTLFLCRCVPENTVEARLTLHVLRGEI
jgi:hypothetical protein